MLKLHLSPSFGIGVTHIFLRLSGNTPVVRDLLMIFVKHGLIMSHIDFKICHRNCIEIPGFIFQRANYCFSATNSVYLHLVVICDRNYWFVWRVCAGKFAGYILCLQGAHELCRLCSIIIFSDFLELRLDCWSAEAIVVL